MDDQRPSLADADSPADVKLVLEYFSRRLLGEDPEYPTLSRHITTHDAMLATDIMLDVLRRAANDPAAMLQVEANVVAQLASVGITDADRR